MLQVALIEPYFTGSHARWAEGYQAHSQYEIKIFRMEGRHWKWRMHGGAYTLANQLAQDTFQPDVLLATDMLDVAAFKGFLPARLAKLPLVLYMHENQLTYPWSPDDQDVKGRQDRHYAFLNYRSMLAADEVWFNSAYHQQAFMEALPGFLRVMPDHRGMETIAAIAQKNRVMPVGVELTDIQPSYSLSHPPTILWNHRWEYDKGPDAFFQALFQVKEAGIPFRLMVAGIPFSRRPKIFNEAKEKLKSEIIHWGFAAGRQAYLELLSQTDLIPVTAQHDFFGISTVEALAAGAFPLLPNRLAYPEHLPDKQRNLHLYQKEEELAARIQAFLQNPLLPDPSLAENVQRYAWEKISLRYDNALKHIKPKKFS